MNHQQMFIPWINELSRRRLPTVVLWESAQGGMALFWTPTSRRQCLKQSTFGEVALLREDSGGGAPAHGEDTTFPCSHSPRDTAFILS